MKEYVLTIAVRDIGHPLTDEMILEFGVPKDSGVRFIECVKQLSDLLAALRTPEKVAVFMQKNQVSPPAHLKLL